MYIYEFERTKSLKDCMVFDLSLKEIFSNYGIDSTSGEIDKNQVWHISVYTTKQLSADELTSITNVIKNHDEFISAEPKPEPPSVQDDTDAMLVDHEYRLTLLELGVM